MGCKQLNNKREELLSYGMNLDSNRTKRYYKAGLLDEINEPLISELQHFWKEHYGEAVDPSIHQAFYNLFGEKNLKLIPGAVMQRKIIPYFNDRRMDVAYRDKNLYDVLFKTDQSVKTIVKRTRGYYYDKNNEILERDKVVHYLISEGSEYIIKPSDSNDGLLIGKLTVSDSNLYLDDKIVDLDKIEEMYEYNFAIQEIIKQHENLAAPHPSSVNTLRMVTLRWKGKIHYLLTFARFGANNSVKDNAGAGGVCVGVTDNGEFLDFAIDANAYKYSKHPTTNYEFKNLPPIENFDIFKEFVMNLHKQVIHHDYISWDIAVDKEAKPVFIEANFAGATWLYQFASKKALFGDLTEEILQTLGPINNPRERNIQVRSAKNKLTKQNKKLKRKLRKSNQEIETLKKELKTIKNSKSWKYTSIFRKKK